jgi:hypothetical protein
MGISSLGKYAGTYEIEVAGPRMDDIEMYVLNDDGSALWYWYSESASLKIHGSEKYGTWRVNGEVISITIQGNAGIINEQYKYFRNGDRYLKKVG